MIDSVRSRKYPFRPSTPEAEIYHQDYCKIYIFIDMPNKNKTMLSPPCPICQTESDRLVTEKNSWSYFRCSSCPLVFLYPQPSVPELTAAYQNYLPESRDQIQAWFRSLEEVIQKSADLIEERVKPGRILDVGSGYGFFLHYMAERGWRADGIEISQPGRNYCRTHFPGLRIQSTPLPDPSIPDSSYDAVTLFYVIEHLADPLTGAPGGLSSLEAGGGTAASLAPYHPDCPSAGSFQSAFGSLPHPLSPF